MVNSVAPVWDGNETWLVLGGGGLFAVFPLAYATIFPALYMPLILMLVALVFRGVAFEMRFRVEGEGPRLRWDRSFSWGSYAAAFCQGICLGALVQGIRVEGRAYAGGWWDWLTLFSVVTGLALVAGYGLLGACWLIWKTEGELQARFRTLARKLGLGNAGLYRDRVDRDAVFAGGVSCALVQLAHDALRCAGSYPRAAIGVAIF